MASSLSRTWLAAPSPCKHSQCSLGFYPPDVGSQLQRRCLWLALRHTDHQPPAGGRSRSVSAMELYLHPADVYTGMHSIKERPVVVDGQIVIRPIMVVALTYDHRLLDGREAVTFLGMLLTSFLVPLFANTHCSYSQGPGLHSGPCEDAPGVECVCEAQPLTDNIPLPIESERLVLCASSIVHAFLTTYNTILFQSEGVPIAGSCISIRRYVGYSCLLRGLVASIKYVGGSHSFCDIG